MVHRDAIAGFILGTAVGDSIGLPREGLSRRRAHRIFGDGPLGQGFVLGRGMISDDTEHTCMVAQALLASGGDPDAFARSLAGRLRGWLAALPAGVGMATLKAILRLWVGFSWRTSGVHSAGNGPAMRAGLLGLFARGDNDLLKSLVTRCTRVTHTDPLAEQGALLIALAARHAGHRCSARPDPQAYLAEACGAVTDRRFLDSLTQMRAALDQDLTAAAFAESLGLSTGISGYILHTVPICLFCWLRYQGDFRQGVEAVVRLGGDADTTGAITGGLLGATLGAAAIPPEWLDRLTDWPRSVEWMRCLAERLTNYVEKGLHERPTSLFWPGLLPRNLLFLMIVLTHGFRRLLPPY